MVQSVHDSSGSVDICHGYRILVANSSGACVILSYKRTVKMYIEKYTIMGAGWLYRECNAAINQTKEGEESVTKSLTEK